MIEIASIGRNAQKARGHSRGLGQKYPACYYRGYDCGERSQLFHESFASSGYQSRHEDYDDYYSKGVHWRIRQF